ncbi:hypothetical protein BWO91_17715 [Plantibacter flavus]|uniref:toll/interleukin-1 receptor domain-containing protein n=1 Tax=Plantibacter flavus TaxID=150123 RepID=UPI00099E1103|nr:toll/interleukin-1 receptor domain-containing protein [Plantibacter flavus]AQX81558.1 hypothetical protein BWO91_17715 [Plantibacter flavus]
MIFLSHTKSDKPLVRDVGAQLTLIGEEVFFDEWSIDVGASIPGAIDIALREYETFVLFWSKEAAASAWTKAEYRSAVSTFLDEAKSSRRLVVVRLDDEPVPALIRHHKWIDGRGNPGAGHIVDQVMGYSGSARLVAMQEYIESLDLGFRYFEGYGVAVACKECGAGAVDLEGFHETDYERDDEYAGVRCKKCGWNDGGEI